ncbi:alpha/beta fold hydrolase [Actinotalea sp. BY-33]|uniref:Alpha/beta fold hydrolase n=1 Tax=Actinotalea soli TaxID=2819234 RepID=A0A939RSW8_9CELL|nr:alpha/beta fold hydrolase [Actinotalea soli]MBO1752767.1 alpha/beta fold hydrolase [Actinotalea soli]
MATQHAVRTHDDRALSVHDTGARVLDAITVVWHHGSPQTGALLRPLLDAAEARGVRLVSYARPSYATSSPRPGRDVASAAADVERVADTLGLDQFAVMGASGGGPHALACAALLPARVTAAVTLAGLAPFTEAFDGFGGMASDAALRAAREGRQARARFAETDEFDPRSFTARDWATLDSTWSALGEDAQAAEAAGPDGLIDDDVAFVSPWGFDPSTISAPVLLVHGGEDRVVPVSHSRRLVETLPDAELWFRPRDGHISVLEAVPLAMDWLREHGADGTH